jgi:hypothetical protein
LRIYINDYHVGMGILQAPHGRICGGGRKPQVRERRTGGLSGFDPLLQNGQTLRVFRKYADGYREHFAQNRHCCRTLILNFDLT